MPGPNEPGANVLTPPATRAHKAWANFWRSVTVYDKNRNERTLRYTQAIKRTSK